MNEVRNGALRMLRSGLVKAAASAGALVAVCVLGGCGGFSPAYLKPLPAQTRALLAQKGMTEQSPLLIRVFKAESELEIWKQRENGRYYHFKTYPICDWSGKLGPKINEGDRQTPEGFYVVSGDQLNPRSQYYLAFNIGFPNAYDRAHGRTGGDIMVHGDCKSRGCFAMTDGLVEEIYVLAREALKGGQRYFQVHSYPFRMTTANMEEHKDEDWYPFWTNLKEGYDYFEVTRQPPRIAVCEKRYLVNAEFVNGVRADPAGPCPPFEKLPVVAAPRNPPPVHYASAGPRDPDALGKPLGSWYGLTFGPAKSMTKAFTLGPANPAPPKKKR